MHRSSITLIAVCLGIGSFLGWEFHKRLYLDEYEQYKSIHNSENAALSYFRGHIFAGLSEAVENEEFGLFYKVTCLMIRQEIEDLEFHANNVSGKGIEERLAKAKRALKKLENSERCGNEI